MMQALLHCAKNSMNMLKNRIQSRTAGTGVFLFVQKPFFEVRKLDRCQNKMLRRTPFVAVGISWLDILVANSCSGVDYPAD